MAIGKNRFSVSRLLTALTIMVLLQACSQNRESAAGPKGTDMQASKQIEQDDVSKPSIDLNIPAEVATATFGLG